MSGKVFLVGAGPGDPELITVKAARCLAMADVVVYDFLANPELLSLAPQNTEMIYVGKKGGDHTMTQEKINELLCTLTQNGKTVVRLKGGDPYVFGRGSEEATALDDLGLDFEVVPGITSAVAAASYAGIPVTDRRHTTEVAFITGHEDPNKAESTINWPSLAGMGSLVFLMGVKNLPNICKQLVAHGKAPDTPAACVRWGTTSRQQTVSGTLADLAEKVAEAGIKPPAITIVGGVVGLRDRLNWFERLPMFGKKVLVTRARKQASKLSTGLRAIGAEVIECPTIEIMPLPEPRQIEWAARHAGDYDWILFTSVNGVEPFFTALKNIGRDVRALYNVKIAAIGPATAQALSGMGLTCDVTARTFVAEGLLEALGEYDLKGKKVLIPRAAQAREVLPETLQDRGALVDVVAAYETMIPIGSGTKIAQAMEDGLDVITFTASSTVRNMMRMLDEQSRADLVKASHDNEITIASIGPVTSETAREHGLKVHLEPEVYTIPDLIAALRAHFSAS